MKREPGRPRIGEKIRFAIPPEIRTALTKEAELTGEHINEVARRHLANSLELTSA